MAHLRYVRSFGMAVGRWYGQWWLDSWKVVWTMVARFLECAMVTHWLPYTPIQKKICLVLVHKKDCCCQVSSENTN